MSAAFYWSVGVARRDPVIRDQTVIGVAVYDGETGELLCARTDGLSALTRGDLPGPVDHRLYPPQHMSGLQKQSGQSCIQWEAAMPSVHEPTIGYLWHLVTGEEL